MNQFDMEKEAGESIAMVKMGQRLPRKTCYFVPEKQYNYLMSLEDSLYAAKKELLITKKELLIMRFVCISLAVICVTVALLV